jgi:TonB family protein
MRFVSLVVGLAAISGTAHAEQAEGLAVTSAEQMSAICQRAAPAESRRLTGNAYERGQQRAAHRAGRDEALDRLYVVDLPAAAYEIEEYDPDDESIVIDARSGLSALDGAVVVTFARDPSLRLAAEPEVAERVAKAHQGRTLRLRLGFYLGASEDDAAPCSLARLGRRVLTVQAEIAFVELRPAAGPALVREVFSDDDVDDESGAPPSGAGGPAGGALVSVSVASGTAAASLTPLLRGEVGQALRRQLEACRPAPASGEPADGTVVVNVTIGRGGHVATAHVEIDSVGDERAASCVLRTARAFRFPSHVVGTASIPVAFGAP